MNDTRAKTAIDAPYGGKPHDLAGINIEHGVPLPTQQFSGNRWQWNQFLKRMGVGDSFFVQGLVLGTSRISTAARRCGIEVTTRVVEGGVRVWRIK